MSPARPPAPSFSARRRFNCALHAALGTLAVLALVVMANYLAARHGLRWSVSSRAEMRLSPQTLGLLRTLTNHVDVTVLYDQRAPYFSTVLGLLREYRLANPRLQVRVVDYLRDNAAALQVFTTYQLSGHTNKNLVIFQCGTNVMRVDGDALMQKRVELVNPETQEFQRRPVAFYGELAFTLALLKVTSANPPRACFLTDHGEHSPSSADEQRGYSKLAVVFWQNCIELGTLSLSGTNAVPEDCNLLVIAGPVKPIPDAELEKIEQYLNQGGRLLALFNSFGTPRQCGLETVLARWGVTVSTNAVVDLKNTTVRGYDLQTRDFAPHAAVKPLYEAAHQNKAALHLIRPRAVEIRDDVAKASDAPTVEPLVRSADQATLDGQSRAVPLAVAIEKGAVKGVVTQRGTTRIVVVGDSLFLGNQMIESASNRDFAACVANWLLDRSQLLVGLGPRRVDEFRLSLSRAQVQTLQWLLLGGLPGAVLVFGSLVWLRRRS